MKERLLYVFAFVILASCFLTGARIIFHMLRAMDCKPNVKIRHHDWEETAWNTWGAGVEERCWCGASRWFASINGAHNPGRIGWNPGPHPGRAELANVKDHSPIGAVGASKPESNSAAPIG